MANSEAQGQRVAKTIQLAVETDVSQKKKKKVKSN